MKPVLIVGLGNLLAGDDGVGRHLATRLRGHPQLPDDVEILEACDMLTLEEDLEDRPLVLLIDALLDDDGPCGRLIPIEDFSALDTRTGSVHHLPPAQAIALLRELHPEIREIPIVLLGVTVRCVQMRHDLSPSLAARLDELVEAILGIIAKGEIRRYAVPFTRAPSRPTQAPPPGVATGSARP